MSDKEMVSCVVLRGKAEEREKKFKQEFFVT